MLSTDHGKTQASGPKSGRFAAIQSNNCWTNIMYFTAVIWKQHVADWRNLCQSVFLLHKSLLFPVGAKNTTCTGTTENPNCLLTIALGTQIAMQSKPLHMAVFCFLVTRKPLFSFGAWVGMCTLMTKLSEKTISSQKSFWQVFRWFPSCIWFFGCWSYVGLLMCGFFCHIGEATK